MAKRSREQIREDEKLVIKYLTEDARQTPNEIAKKCGFSRQKSWRIIKRLEEKREIWGYTAIVDEEKMNETTFVALIRSKSPIIDMTKKLADRLKSEKSKKEVDIELIDVFFLHGAYDWMVIFNAKDIRHATRYVGYLEKNYGERIIEIRILENVFPLVKGGKTNPNIEKITEFSV